MPGPAGLDRATDRVPRALARGFCMKPRILVIRGGAIGDFVLTLPAIRLLRENFAHGPPGNPRLQAHRGAGGRAVLRGCDAVDRVRRAVAVFHSRARNCRRTWSSTSPVFSRSSVTFTIPDGYFEGNIRRAGVKHYPARIAGRSTTARTRRSSLRSRSRAWRFTSRKRRRCFSRARRTGAFAADFIQRAFPGDGRSAHRRASRQRRRAEELAGGEMGRAGRRALPDCAVPARACCWWAARRTARRSRICGRRGGAGPIATALDLPLPELAAILRAARLFLATTAASPTSRRRRARRACCSSARRTRTSGRRSPARRKSSARRKMTWRCCPLETVVEALNEALERIHPQIDTDSRRFF